MEFVRKSFTFFSHGSNKRAISAIVAVVLTILITVAGVTVVWTAIVPIIKESAAFETFDASLIIDTQGGYTYYDPAREVTCVQVKRGAGDGELVRIDVMFSFGGTTHTGSFSGDDIPGVNEAKMKCFDVGGFGGAPGSVSIAPVFLSGNKQVAQEVTSSIDSLKKGTYSGLDADLGGVEGQCENDAGCSVDENELLCLGDVAVNRLTEYSCSDLKTCVAEVSDSEESCSGSTPVCSVGVCVECVVDGDCSGGTCVGDVCVVSSEVDCDDGIDNDGDNYFDCADQDCSGYGEGYCDYGETCAYDCSSEYDASGGCSDGADNDEDGDSDCYDPDCSSDPSCVASYEYEYASDGCFDGVDNDGDSFYDCDDSDCSSDSSCYESDCYDDTDNDNDGYTDCADEDCSGYGEGYCDYGETCSYDCTYEHDVSGGCSDGADNDEDGSYDCSDPDCKGYDGCPIK